MASEIPILRNTAMVGLMNDHESHPDFGHLTLLVFEAVLEVVCVALPGYIVARRGMFDADAQKMLANMNVQIFTPCLGEFGACDETRVGDQVADNQTSLYKVGFPAQCRQIGRSGRHSLYFRGPDSHLVALR